MSGTRTAGSAVRALLRPLGIDVRRVPPPRPEIEPAKVTEIPKTSVFSADTEFHDLYDAGLTRSGMYETSARRPRFYNLVQALQLTKGASGLVIECGVFRGLSSFMLCHYLKLEESSFKGEDVHLFDSFEGLSAGTPEDRPRPDLARTANGFGDAPGEYAASTDHVRNTLTDFPEVTLHKGWIPDSFADAPTGPIRFVHLDVDLYQPTLDAVRFFHPHLAVGGAVLCDDYGTLKFPGVQKAIDEYCAASGAPLLRLATGQALMLPVR